MPATEQTPRIEGEMPVVSPDAPPAPDIASGTPATVPLAFPPVPKSGQKSTNLRTVILTAIIVVILVITGAVVFFKLL